MSDAILYEHGGVAEKFGAETLMPHEEAAVIPPQLWFVKRLQDEYITTGQLPRDAYVNVADELGMTLEQFFDECTTAEIVDSDLVDGAKAELVGRKVVKISYEAATRAVVPNYAD